MIICADDFGQSLDINEAIIELASLGKIQAVTCMVMLPQCTNSTLGPLLKYSPPLLLGLHLVLTEEKPIASLPKVSTLTRQGRLPSFQALLIKSYTKKLILAQLKQEISAQYEIFRAKAGREPDFIDGHLFTHQFPVIREALIQFVKKMPLKNRPFIRISNTPIKRIFQRRISIVKNLIISYPGRKLYRRLIQEGISCNQDFAGIYNYKHFDKFPKYFLRFIKYTDQTEGMIMVHPGTGEEFRKIEYLTLLGKKI